jgi:hypothetical protein
MANSRITISTLSKALAPAGVHLPDELTKPVVPLEIPAPDDQEIAAAIAAAKGDPAADKTVQRLLTARSIARGGFTDLLEQQEWDRRLTQIRDSLEDLNAALHERFTEAVGQLAQDADALAGYADLDALVLSALPDRDAAPARRAIDAQNRLRAVVKAWRALWSHLADRRLDGRFGEVLAVCDPTPEQWLEHSTRRPSSVPAGSDLWGMVRIGWPLDLADSPRDAKRREQEIEQTIDGDRDERAKRKGIAMSWGAAR